MSFAINILTPLMAFCLFGTGYHWTAQEKHFDRATVEKATKHEAQILILGYCDSSGSEVCTAALAMRRGEVVQQFLLRLATQANQIAGVKG